MHQLQQRGKAHAECRKGHDCDQQLVERIPLQEQWDGGRENGPRSMHQQVEGVGEGHLHPMGQLGRKALEGKEIAWEDSLVFTVVTEGEDQSTMGTLSSSSSLKDTGSSKRGKKEPWLRDQALSSKEKPSRCVG